MSARRRTADSNTAKPQRYNVAINTFTQKQELHEEDGERFVMYMPFTVIMAN